MKIIPLAAFFLLMLMKPGFSQVLNSENLQGIKIDALSDDEVKSYYQKAMASGLSQDQLLKMAMERGLPNAEATKLKLRFAAIGQAGSSGLSASRGTVGLELENSRNLSEPFNGAVLRLNRDTTIFGNELFATASMGFESSHRIATPANYTLGPGDQLIVSVFGFSEKTYKLTVGNEGFVYIPNVGPITVSGSSIADATEKIRNKLATTIYKALKTGQTKLQVLLGDIRSIQVTVIGQASRPATYTVSSLTTLFNLLYECGGPSDMGSYRNIEVIRNNSVFRIVDLYSFLLSGNRQGNVLLKDQDVVRIPYFNTRVQIEGQVKRPGKFEALEGENFDKLLGYTGGFSDSAWRGSVKVTRLQDKGILINDLKAAAFSAFQPKTGDAYFVTKGISRYVNRVTIAGATERTGEFELKQGLTLKQLIEQAGGLKPDAFPERGIINRLNADLTPASISFNAAMVLNGTADFELKPEDYISIPFVYDLKDQPFLEIKGEIRRPGSYVFQDNISLKDLITKAGGFTDLANRNSIEITRPLKNANLQDPNARQVEIIRLNLGNGLIVDSNDLKLMPNDNIVVRSEAGLAISRAVYLEGQVLNTGKFVLTGPRERISSILKRSGGFSSSADSGSINIKRYTNLGLSRDERQRNIERILKINRDSLIGNSLLRDNYLKDVEMLSVNVEKIMQNPGGNEDLILEDGDIISVPRASKLIRVTGEVFHPTSLAYETQTNARFYIKRAGDYTASAKRSKVFVIYPDGRAQSVKKFLFFRKYPVVSPRSEIFVPSRNIDGKKSMSTGEWIAASSILASLATMAIAIVNATK